MSLLHLVANYVATRHKQSTIRASLTRLNGRALADLGVERARIPLSHASVHGLALKAPGWARS